jgi:hypothetical protein
MKRTQIITIVLSREDVDRVVTDVIENMPECTPSWATWTKPDYKARTLELREEDEPGRILVDGAGRTVIKTVLKVPTTLASGDDFDRRVTAAMSYIFSQHPTWYPDSDDIEDMMHCLDAGCMDIVLQYLIHNELIYG